MSLVRWIKSIVLLSSVGILAVALSDCNGHAKKNSDDVDSGLHTDTTFRLEVKYAKGFETQQIGHGVCLVKIHDPQGRKSTTDYFAFVRDGADTRLVPKDYKIIKVPVTKVICMTTLQLSNFIKLGAQSVVTGITSTRFLYDPVIKEQIRKGITSRIGIEGNFDTELIMAANPDIILYSPFKRGGYESLKEVDIPLIPHLGYKEMTPLGQAEWIKLAGILLGREVEASLIFDSIASRYEHLCQLTDKVEKRPTVMSGEMRGGNWYAVGGKSFLAKLFEDAGADYFLKDDTHSGGINLDFETVYNQASHCDYWRIVNSYNGTFSYKSLADEDARYTDFDAYKKHRILYCNMREKPFYESMPMEPDIVLSDLIKAFHPQLLPQHKPKYYELLP